MLISEVSSSPLSCPHIVLSGAALYCLVPTESFLEQLTTVLYPQVLSRAALHCLVSSMSFLEQLSTVSYPQVLSRAAFHCLVPTMSFLEQLSTVSSPQVLSRAALHCLVPTMSFLEQLSTVSYPQVLSRAALHCLVSTLSFLEQLPTTGDAADAADTIACKIAMCIIRFDMNLTLLLHLLQFSPLLFDWRGATFLPGGWNVPIVTQKCIGSIILFLIGLTSTISFTKGSFFYCVLFRDSSNSISLSLSFSYSMSKNVLRSFVEQ